MRTILFATLFSVTAHTALNTAVPAADPPTATALAAQVNPFIATGGNRHVCGNNPPAATRPFGMIRLGPDTISAFGATATNMSGYYYHDPHLLGFSHTRLCGTGAIDGGHFRVTPGRADMSVEELRQRRLEYSHDHESASPGYYSVDLPSVASRAELTATTRVGLHRYTWDAGVTPALLIDVGSALGQGRSSECAVRLDPERREISGQVRTFGSFSGRYGGLQVFFAAHCLTPWESSMTWSGDTVEENSSSAQGDDVGVVLTFPEAVADQPVELAIAISHVSLENAQKNLRTELADQTFDSVRIAAAEEWNSMLSRARVTGGTPEDQTIFYTALYRTMMMPTTFNDVNGQYRGFDQQIHTADDFTYYTDMSLWDTFRTTHPLYTLLLPDHHRDMLVSLVAMAEQGGNLPRWPSGCGYTNSMFGAPTEVAVAEAWLKGIRDFDVQTAWKVMRRAAMEPAPEGSAWSGRGGIAEFIQLGYCPSDKMSKAVARTLEYSTTDAAIGRLAASLGYDDDARLFEERGRSYRQLWNPETQYFQPRDSAGQFSTPLKPTLLTYFDFTGRYTDDYVEGSALQWRWAVSHDAAGLVELFSSPEEFASELNHFFENAPAGIGRLPNGYYWQGNQPDIHAAYLFNAAGRPDLTQKWVRWILKTKHDATPVGLDGNDDGGTLSAWYVLSSLGFYPVVGTDRYELGSPLWTEATLQLGNSKLHVIAEGNSPEHVYVQQVELNGRVLDRTWFTHDEIAAGGTLRFVMSDQPTIVTE